jgi:hypothetical protein
MSKDLLQKVITTTHLGTAPDRDGLLSPDQADRFIDYMWDATVLGQQVRQVRMRADTVELDRMAVGKRLLRGATEAVDDGVNVGLAWAKVSLTSTKLRLDWELSSESLEDGIEGAALEDHVARLMSQQAAEDLEFVMINGDTTLGGDPLLKTMDGWAKRGEVDGRVLDHGGAAIDRAVFHRALKEMPRQYRQRRGELKFFTGAGIIQDYIFSLQATSSEFITPEALALAGINQTTVAEGPAGFTTGNAFGIPVQEVPLMDEFATGDYSGAGAADAQHGSVWLTFPKNLIWGIKRDIVVYREFKPKKDTIEYTLYVRAGSAVENPDAFVVVKNVRIED